MQPGLESLGVLLLSAIGWVLGWWFSRRPKPWWILGYLLPLAFIAAIGLARRFSILEMTPPWTWLMAGRTEFAMTGFLVTMIFATLLPKVPRRRDRKGIAILIGLAIFTTALPPFAAPIFNRDYLQRLPTNFDVDGVCRQSNDYTCGPAAAVTALRTLGVDAEEGEIAILAKTTRWTGTEPDMLAEALRHRYSAAGIQIEYKAFRSIDELRGPFVTIARIKYNLLLDHYITILRVTETHVLAADPMSGLKRLTRAEFEKSWRFCGVVLKRSSNSSPSLAEP